MNTINTIDLIEKRDELRNILISYDNPEYGDCILDEITKLFGFPSTFDDEPKGEFVNDGLQYQLYDYVLRPFNTDEGFTNIEVTDYDDNIVYEIAGVEMIDEYSEIEDILEFEEVVKILLVGEGLL